MRKLFISLLLACVCAVGHAQTDLTVARWFNPDSAAVTTVSQADLEHLDLKHFRVAVLNASEAMNPQLAESVAGLEPESTFMDVDRADGRVRYGFYNLLRRYGLNRYMLYVDRTPEGAPGATLIYLAGDASRAQVLDLLHRGDNEATYGWNLAVPEAMSSRGSADSSRERRHVRLTGLRGALVGPVMPVGGGSGAFYAGCEAGVINVLGLEVSPTGGRACFNVGLGAMWHYIDAASGMRFDKTDGALTIVPTDGLDVDHSAMHWWSLTVPVMWSQPIHRSLGFSVGAVVNFNTSVASSTRWKDGDSRYTESYRGLHQRPVTVDLLFEAGALNAIGVYVKYSPMRLMRKGYGPELHTVSAGVTFNF